MAYKKSRKSPAKRSKKGSKKGSKKRVTRNSCQNALKRKIAINIDEYKKGRYVSRAQAVAVSYSQVKKSKPSCSRYFKRK